jgi:hypothetical protein
MRDAFGGKTKGYIPNDTFRNVLRGRRAALAAAIVLLSHQTVQVQGPFMYWAMETWALLASERAPTVPPA